MKKNLDKIIEGILFVNGDPVAIPDIKDKLEVTRGDVETAVERLQQKYAAEDSGVILLRFGNKLQLASNPAFVEQIASVLNPIKEKELSRACMETLAIIAYRQPITRLEIEDVRGVSSEYTVSVLEKNNLIEVVGKKDAIGRPLLYGTTDEFLKRFRMESLDELPDYDDLLERLQTIELPAAPVAAPDGDTLYNHFDVPVEPEEVAAEQEELPDFLRGEEIVGVGELEGLSRLEEQARAEAAATTDAADAAPDGTDGET